MKYYLAARRLFHTKWHLDIVCRTIRPFRFTVIHLVRTHSALINFIVIPLNYAIGTSSILYEYWDENYWYPIFLPSMILIVTTDKGFIEVPLDKLNLL